jgi:hypothetical protein
MTMDIKDIVGQVQSNCELSDAKNWGAYTICGLLIRLTDLYRWSKGLDPWVTIENPKLMEWVGEKEEAWDKIKDSDYKKIIIDGRKFDPFDTDGINDVLMRGGYVYGAGYVTKMKPSFFLGKIEDTHKRSGHETIVVGRELARDLITSPALYQRGKIFVRTEPAKSFIWDKIAEYKFGGAARLKNAFGECGVDIDDIRDFEEVNRIATDELESYIHHEIGEARDTTFPEEKWEEIVSAYPQTLVEKFTRAVKDILADTNEHGPLAYIVEGERKGSLGFYIAFLGGMRKVLFGEIVTAFESYDGDWSIIEEARVKGREKAVRYAKQLIQMHDGGRSHEEIEEEFILPLLP